MRKCGKTSQETSKKKKKSNHAEDYEECHGLEKGGSDFSPSDQERVSRGDI